MYSLKHSICTRLTISKAVACPAHKNLIDENDQNRCGHIAEPGCSVHDQFFVLSTHGSVTSPYAAERQKPSHWGCNLSGSSAIKIMPAAPRCKEGSRDSQPGRVSLAPGGSYSCASGFAFNTVLANSQLCTVSTISCRSAGQDAAQMLEVSAKVVGISTATPQSNTALNSKCQPPVSFASCTSQLTVAPP